MNFVRRDADGRLTGDNIDGAGFIDGARESGIVFKGKRVLQIGAGGAAVRSPFPLPRPEPPRLDSATAPRRRPAISPRPCAPHTRVRCLCRAADAAGYHAVVNTTSLGMKPDDPLRSAILRV